MHGAGRESTITCSRSSMKRLRPLAEREKRPLKQLLTEFPTSDGSLLYWHYVVIHSPSPLRRQLLREGRCRVFTVRLLKRTRPW